MANSELVEHLGGRSKEIQNLVARFPFGCSCYEAVFNEQGRIADLIIVDMNSHFEALSGLKKQAVIGLQITQAFQSLTTDIIQDITKLGNEAYVSAEKTANAHLRIFNHAYQVSLFFISDTLMVTIFQDIQPQFIRKYYRHSIPYDIITTSIAQDVLRINERENRLTDTAQVRNDMPLVFLPNACDFYEKNDASFRDSLTGLYGRLFAMTALKMHIEKGTRPLSIILGNVNGLKMINDAMGFGKGDEILIKLSGFLLKQCREGDVVARWSSDEFLLLLPHVCAEKAQKITNRLQREVDKYCKEDNCPTITFGYATCEGQFHTPEELVQEAEKRVCQKKLLVSQSNRNDILKLLLSILHEKSAETQTHSERVADYCCYLAQELDLSEDMINDLTLLSMLHDIGKVGVRHEILNKPGPLTEQERREVQRHCEIGCRITQHVPELINVSAYILAHHEWWDGSGYPNGLQGEDIPIASRILSVVDAYDVMISGRIYRAARSKEEAIDELNRCGGTQFDPNIVRVFTDLIMSGAEKAPKYRPAYWQRR